MEVRPDAPQKYEYALIDENVKKMMNDDTLEINNKDITGGRQIHTDNPAVLHITQMHTSRSSRTSGNILTNQNIRYQKLPESDLHDNRENAALSESQISSNEEESLKIGKGRQVHEVDDTKYPKYCKYIEFLTVVIIISVVSLLLIKLLRRPWVEALERK